ncbi:MAG: DUF3187 family protein [Fimbriimonas sp.]
MRPPVCLFALALSAGAAAQDFGPIETRNLRSLSVPFLRIDPRTPVLEKGERTLSVGFTAANDLRRYGAGAVDEDYELDRLLLRYRMGLADGWDVTFDLPLLSRGGGFLDPFIETWHDLVLDGFPSHNRAGTPYGRSYVRVPGTSWGSATGIGDASAWATKRINDRLMATAAIKLPVGNAGQGLGSGNFDIALALQARVPLLRKLDLHLQGGVVAQGAATGLDSTRSLVHQGAAALTYRSSSRDNWVIQWQSEDSATVTGIAPSDAGHRIFSAAWQRRIGAGQTMEFFFSEDQDWPNFPIVRLANQGPDFTAGIRYIRRF